MITQIQLEEIYLRLESEGRMIPEIYKFPIDELVDPRRPWLITIPQLVKAKCQHLLCLKEEPAELIAKGVTFNGAADKPYNEEKFKKDGYLWAADDPRICINVLIQRVGSIESEAIAKDIEEGGGFLHSKCPAIDLVMYPDGSYGSAPDKMHRLIIAYICGVNNLRINPYLEHTLSGDFDEDVETIMNTERKAFNHFNKEQRKVSKEASDKADAVVGGNSSYISTRNFATKSKLHFTDNSDYNPNEPDEDSLVYKNGTVNFQTLLMSKNSPLYLGEKECEKQIDFLRTLKRDSEDPDQQRRAQIDTAIMWVRSQLESVVGEETVKLFDSWLSKQDLSSGQWTGLNSTGRAVETACVRFLVFCYADLREKSNTRLFSPDPVTTDAIFGKLIPFQGIESNKFIKAVVIYGENPLSQLDGTIGTTK